MRIVKMDEKGRVHLTRGIREELRLRPHEVLEASVRDTTLTLKPFRKRKVSRKEDSLDWILRNPAHVSRKKLKEIDLEKIEDEMWMP